ncbi:hypothetical protein [Malonomonas rubra]|uniref:hypothetical protein n=1 Tax=Malonomonas rubra TaxID=57040 RepID=UPI0026F08DE5|nr:hypothetical protein [Malonomonas rubra]
MTVENRVPEKSRVAIHQAGHAVAQALVGRGRFEVAHVSLASEHGGTWRGVPAVGDASIDREMVLGLYEFGLVTLAGIAAEERYQAMSDPEEEPLVAISDLADWHQQAWQVLQSEARIQLVGLNVMQKLQQWFANKQVWQVVESLARELLEKDSVQGARLQFLLAPLQQE